MAEITGENVKVVVRIRPISGKVTSCIEKVTPESVTIHETATLARKFT
jgi:hypothetical protein